MTSPLRRATRARINRRHRLVFFAVLILLAMGAVILSVPRKAGGEETWQALLGEQLRAEQGCVLSVLLQVRKIPIGGAETVEGKARCADGREFDFTQSRPHQKFDLKRCEPVLC